jgi:hypothetical protein
MTVRGNRGAIYAAENECVTAYFSSVEGAQVFSDRICRSKWWRDHCITPAVRHILIKYPVPAGMSGTHLLDDNLGEIRFTPLALSGLNMCHEHAHFLTWIYAGEYSNPKQHDEEDHSPAFARAELEIVKRFLSQSDYSQLEKYFIKYKVKYDPPW